MIGASKILTVSYGTFSCTLEGFDEPFNTMKAIAEYFRDLAAEDRYFGAEPPTPDAAMLHRIAEREIQRRVEAKIQDNGVILRAGDAEAPALAAAITAPTVTIAPTVAIAPSVTTVAAVDASGESVTARLSRLRAAQNAPVQSTPAALEAHEPAIHHVAEAAALADDSYSEDQHSDDILANIAALAAPEPAAATVQAEPLPEALIASDSTADHQAASEIASEIEAPEIEAQEPDTQDFDTQDLADLTALDVPAELLVQPEVDAQDIYTEDLAYEQDLGYEDDTAQASDGLAAAFADDLPVAAALPDTLIADAAPVIETAVVDDFVADTVADTVEFAAEAASLDTEILADALPEHDPIVEAAAYADEDMLASLGALIAENDQIQPKTNEAIASEAQIESETLIESDDYEDDGIEDDLLLANVAQNIEPEAAAPALVAADLSSGLPAERAADREANLNAEPPAEPGEKIQRARARVIKIRRADAPAAQPQTSLLSPEAEAALQAELAALEADSPAETPMAPVRPNRPMRNLAPRPAVSEPEDAALAAALADDQAAVAAEVTADPQPVHHAESRKLLETESDDDAVERLMAATNSAMDDEDSRRRQSAISHLKAAVAATEAERQINATKPGKPAPDHRQDIYRHDLESVVRTKPADTNVEARAAANAERLTPLVLVSEQRIDRPKPLTAVLAAVAVTPRVVMPVRPRRVSGAAAMAAMQAMPNQDSLISETGDDQDDDDLSADEDGNFFDDGQNFADFAEKLGATTLAELLEASAVYCVQVLGRPNFSRPLVIRQLETLIDQPDQSREDCLRAFGTLLRQGRITKIKRGQFSMTDRSPLLAEAQRISA